MNITADTVKQLRERTGAGMMECKQALVETEGDLDAAAELMRKSGLAKADKKAARVAAEGADRRATAAGASAAMVEVNCETDFVARSEEFQAFARDVAQAALGIARRRRRRWCSSAGRRDPRGAAARADRQDRREHRRAPLRALTRPAALGAYVHGTRIGGLVALEGGDEALARISRCMWRPQSGATWTRARCRPRCSTRSARSHRADQGREKATGDHRQDGRGTAAQVPRRDHPARSALRQGAGDHRGEAPEEVGRAGGASSCATRSAPASRRSRMTSSAR